MTSLELENGSLYYDVTGAGDPLVFLHGGWMNSDTWAEQVDRYAGDYRVITMDLRGHGRTGVTDPSRYSIDLFADDLEALLAHLDVSEPIVCGLSLGNLVAQEYLARHPDRPAAAILGGPARSMPPVEVPAWTKFGTYPEAGLRTTLSLTGTKGTFRSMLSSIRAATGSPWISVDPEIRAQAIEDAGAISQREYAKIFGALYRYDPPALTHVETPTMAIFGEGESPFVKRQGRQIADAVEQGAVRSIPDAAHLVNMDNPTAFNAALDEFLETVGVAA